MRQIDSDPAPQTRSHAASPVPDRPFTLQRVALACVGVIGTGLLLALAGCPANLANPEDYNHDKGPAAGGAMPGGGAGNAGGAMPGGGAGNAGGAMPGGGAGNAGGGNAVDVPVPGCMNDILMSSCALTGCHLGPIAAMLDLTPAGVGKRLVDVTAGHFNAFPDTGCVAGQKLIDSANPANSWLIQKLTTDGTKCGLAMPIGTALDATQVACFTMYANAVAAAAKGSP